MDNGVVGSARFFLELDMQKFQQALQKSGTEFSGLVKNVNNMSDSITKDIDKINKKAESMSGAFKFTELKSKIDLMKGAYASLRNTVQEFVSEYQEQVENENKLLALMKNRGDYTEQQYIKFLAFSNKMMATTNFADDQVLNAISQFQTFTNIRQDIMQEAVKLSADVAATTRQDLQSVSVQLAKALSDPTLVSGLKRSGVMINEEVVKTFKTLEEQQAYILSEVRKQYAGAAEGARNSVKSMANIFSDLKESIGKNLMPVFDLLSQGLQKVFEGIGWFTGQLKSLFSSDTDWAMRLRELKVALESFRQEIDSLNNLENIANQYDALSQKAEKLGGVTKLTTDEQNKFNEALKQIQKEMPGVITQFDAQGNALKANIQFMREMIQIQRTQAKEKVSSAIDETLATATQVAENYRLAKIARERGLVQQREQRGWAGNAIQDIGMFLGKTTGLDFGLNKKITSEILNLRPEDTRAAQMSAQDINKATSEWAALQKSLNEYAVMLATTGQVTDDQRERFNSLIATVRQIDPALAKYYENMLSGVETTARLNAELEVNSRIYDAVANGMDLTSASGKKLIEDMYELAKSAGIATQGMDEFKRKVMENQKSISVAKMVLSTMGQDFGKLSSANREKLRVTMQGLENADISQSDMRTGLLNRYKQLIAEQDAARPAARPSTPAITGQKVKEPKPEKVREIKPERMFDFLKRFGDYLDRFSDNLEGLAKSLHDETKAFEKAVGDGFKMAYSEQAVIQASLTGDLQKIADNLNQQKILAFMEKTGASYVEASNKIVKVTTSELEIYAQRLQSVMRDFQENFAQEVFMLGKGDTFKKVSGINENYDKMMQKFYQYEQTYKKVGGSITPEEMKKQIQQEYTRQRQEAIEESRSNIRKFYQDETTTKLEELRKQAEQIRKQAKDLSDTEIRNRINEGNELVGATNAIFKRAIELITKANTPEDIPIDVQRLGSQDRINNASTLREQFETNYKFYLDQEKAKKLNSINAQIRDIRRGDDGRSESERREALHRLQAEQALEEGEVLKNALARAKQDTISQIKQQLYTINGLAREGEVYADTEKRLVTAYKKQKSEELANVLSRITEQEQIQAETEKYNEMKNVKQMEGEFAGLLGDFFKSSFLVFEIEREDTQRRAKEYKRKATAAYTRQIQELEQQMMSGDLSQEQSIVIQEQINKYQEAINGLDKFIKKIDDAAETLEKIKSVNAVVGFIDSFQKAGFTFAKELKGIIKNIGKDKSFMGIVSSGANIANSTGNFLGKIGEKLPGAVGEGFKMASGLLTLPKSIIDGFKDMFDNSAEHLANQQKQNQLISAQLEYQLFIEQAIVRQLQDRQEQLNLISKLYYKTTDETKKNLKTEQILEESIALLKEKYLKSYALLSEEQQKEAILAKQKELQAARESIKGQIAGLALLQATVNATDDENKDQKIAQYEWYKIIFNAQMQSIDAELNAYEQYADYEQQLYELKQAQNEELRKALGLQLKISDEVLKQLYALNNADVNKIIDAMYGIEAQIKTGAVREGSAEAINKRKALMEQLGTVLKIQGNTELGNAVAYALSDYYNEADLKKFLALAGKGTTVTFAQGGYTGDGAGVAGLVHQGEVVLNSGATQALSERLGVNPRYLQGALLASQGSNQNVIIDGVNIVINGNADRNTIRELENKLYEVLPKIMNRRGLKWQ